MDAGRIEAVVLLAGTPTNGLTAPVGLAGEKMIVIVGTMIEAESLGAEALGTEEEVLAQGGGGIEAQFGRAVLSEELKSSNGTGKGRNKQKQLVMEITEPMSRSLIAMLDS